MGNQDAEPVESGAGRRRCSGRRSRPDEVVDSDPEQHIWLLVGWLPLLGVQVLSGSQHDCPCAGCTKNVKSSAAESINIHPTIRLPGCAGSVETSEASCPILLCRRRAAEHVPVSPSCGGSTVALSQYMSGPMCSSCRLRSQDIGYRTRVQNAIYLGHCRVLAGAKLCVSATLTFRGRSRSNSGSIGL